MDEARLDTCLELVADRRRRAVIQQLRSASDDMTTVDDLADRLVEAEGVPGTSGHPDRDRVTNRLIHSHLPKLDENDVIDYDQERLIVQYQPDERVEAVLDALSAEVPQVS